MNKIRIFAIVAALAMVLMGASGCKGKTKSQSCRITARDTTSITTQCSTDQGKTWGPEERMEGIYSDLYPNCQVGTYWPGCKGK